MTFCETVFTVIGGLLKSKSEWPVPEPGHIMFMQEMSTEELKALSSGVDVNNYAGLGKCAQNVAAAAEYKR